MASDASYRPLEVFRRRISTPRNSGRTIAALLLTAALAPLAQLACNDGSPTSPPPPPPPRPQLDMVATGAAYRVLITPFNEERTFPRSAELLVDGRSIWAGDVRPPYIYNSSYGPYEIPAGVGAQIESTLSAGTHTLSFRITDQERSPTGYYLSGGVDIYWQGYQYGDTPVGQREVENVLHWQDATARLRTGQEWSIEFVVRDRSTH